MRLNQWKMLVPRKIPRVSREAGKKNNRSVVQNRIWPGSTSVHHWNDTMCVMLVIAMRNAKRCNRRSEGFFLSEIVSLMLDGFIRSES